MKIYHWWPGRTWAGPCPIPNDIIQEAEKRRTRYLTVAKNTGFPLVYGIAWCNPKDVPNRKLGRHIATSRLEKNMQFCANELNQR